MNKKLLIASIFATLMLLVQMTSVVGINTDVDDEARENYEIEPLDNYREIISHIHAWGEDGTISVKKSGGGIFFRHVEIWADNIEISGIRCFLIFPIPFKEDASHIIAPCCFIFGPDHTSPGWACLFAFALGDIEWE